MSYPIILLYPDADATDTGQVYLPGEPVRFGTNVDCGLCGTALGGHPDYWPGSFRPDLGAHLGFVQVTGSDNGLDEWCHLRCVFDCTDCGSVGVQTPGGWFDSQGRHAAA